MTASKFMWAVIAGRGHSSEQLGRGFTVGPVEEKAKVNEHIDRLRRQRRTDWIGVVLDLSRSNTWESCEGYGRFWPRGVKRPADRHRSPSSNSLLLARAGACGDGGWAVSNTFQDRDHFRRGDRQPVLSDLG